MVQAALTVTTRHVLKVQVPYRTIIVLISYANNHNKTICGLWDPHTKEPIIYYICRKWWAPSGPRGRIYHLRVLFFFLFSKVVGRALRIAGPERFPLFFLWRLCVQVSLSLPQTSLLSFQKQKSHASKSKGKKRSENMKEHFLLNSRKTQIIKIVIK